MSGKLIDYITFKLFVFLGVEEAIDPKLDFLVTLFYMILSLGFVMCSVKIFSTFKYIHISLINGRRILKLAHSTSCLPIV